MARTIGIVDVPAYGGGGTDGWPFWDIRGYVTFADAIAAIGATQATLGIDVPLAVAANITVPANVTLFFTEGGSLVIANAVTVRINGDIQAGDCQIFSWVGTGRVVFGAGAILEVYPEWFGAVGNGVADDQIPIQVAITAAVWIGRVKLAAKTYLISAEVTHLTDADRAPGLKIVGSGMRQTFIDSRVANGYAIGFRGRSEYINAVFKNQFGSGIYDLSITTFAGIKPVVSSAIFADCQYMFSMENVHIYELTGNGITNTVYMNGVSFDYGMTQGFSIRHVFIHNCDGWGVTNFGALDHANYYQPVLVSAEDLTIYGCGQGGWRACLMEACISVSNFGYNGYYNAGALGSGILFDLGGGITQQAEVRDSHFEANQHYNICVLEGNHIALKRNRHRAFLGDVGGGARILHDNPPVSDGVPNLADTAFGINGVSGSWLINCLSENESYTDALCPTYIAFELGHVAYSKIINCEIGNLHANGIKYRHTGSLDNLIEELNVLTGNRIHNGNYSLTNILKIGPEIGNAHGWPCPHWAMAGHISFASTAVWRTVATITFAANCYGGGYLEFAFGGIQNAVGDGKAVAIGTFNKNGAGNPTYTALQNIVTNAVIQVVATGATELAVQMESTNVANKLEGNFFFRVIGSDNSTMVVAAPGYSDP